MLSMTTVLQISTCSILSDMSWLQASCGCRARGSGCGGGAVCGAGSGGTAGGRRADMHGKRGGQAGRSVPLPLKPSSLAPLSINPTLLAPLLFKQSFPDVVNLPPNLISVITRACALLPEKGCCVACPAVHVIQMWCRVTACLSAAGACCKRYALGGRYRSRKRLLWRFLGSTACLWPLLTPPQGSAPTGIPFLHTNDTTSARKRHT